MRPVNYRRASGVVHHFAAHFDTISDVNRAARGDRNVVDDLERAGGASRGEGFVHAVRARSVKEAGCGGNRRLEVDLRRRGAGICCEHVHCGTITWPNFATRARRSRSEVSAQP